MNPQARADAVILLAGCEKNLAKWQRIVTDARESGDTETAEMARQVVDALLDLRAILTEHVGTVTV